VAIDRGQHRRPFFEHGVLADEEELARRDDDGATDQGTAFVSHLG